MKTALEHIGDACTQVLFLLMALAVGWLVGFGMASDAAVAVHDLPNVSKSDLMTGACG